MPASMTDPPIAAMTVAGVIRESREGRACSGRRHGWSAGPG